MEQAAPHHGYFEQQFNAVFAELKEINTKLGLLQRQDDLSTAERKNHDWRLQQLEEWRAQAPQQARSNWNLSLNGCSTLAFAASAVAGFIGAFAGVAAVIVAILLKG